MKTRLLLILMILIFLQGCTSTAEIKKWHDEAGAEMIQPKGLYGWEIGEALEGKSLYKNMDARVDISPKHEARLKVKTFFATVRDGAITSLTARDKHVTGGQVSCNRNMDVSIKRFQTLGAKIYPGKEKIIKDLTRGDLLRARKKSSGDVTYKPTIADLGDYRFVVRCGGYDKDEFLLSLRKK